MTVLFKHVAIFYYNSPNFLILKVAAYLDSRKVTQYTDIRVKTLRGDADFFEQYLLIFKESLCEKCPDSHLFWSVFFRIRTKYGEMRIRIDTEYLSAFSPNAGKYGPE